MDPTAARLTQQNLLLLIGAVAASLGAFSMSAPSTTASPVTMARASVRPTATWADLPADASRAEAYVDDEEFEVYDDDEEGWYPPSVPRDLPPPDVVLIGTAVSNRPELHTAMFRYSGKSNARLHHPGDVIQGYVLERVDRRSVVLVGPDYTRHQYSLSLYPDGDGGSEVVASKSVRDDDGDPQDDRDLDDDRDDSADEDPLGLFRTPFYKRAKGDD